MLKINGKMSIINGKIKKIKREMYIIKGYVRVNSPTVSQDTNRQKIWSFLSREVRPAQENSNCLRQTQVNKVDITTSDGNVGGYWLSLVGLWWAQYNIHTHVLILMSTDENPWTTCFLALILTKRYIVFLCYGQQCKPVKTLSPGVLRQWAQIYFPM